MSFDPTDSIRIFLKTIALICTKVKCLQDESKNQIISRFCKQNWASVVLQNRQRHKIYHVKMWEVEKMIWATR